MTGSMEDAMGVLAAECVLDRECCEAATRSLDRIYHNRQPSLPRTVGPSLYSNWMEFEWDPEKDRQYQVKHGISFEEASTVSGKPFALTIGDPDHTVEESRFLTTGCSSL